MKRVLSLALALCLLAGVLTVNAGAVYSKDGNNFNTDNATNQSTAGQVAVTGLNGEAVGEATVDVYLKTGAPGEVTHVYAVSYDVTELEFQYGNSASKIWNPETLRYETTGSSGGWNIATQTVTVTNYSDLPVKVTASISALSDTGVSIDTPEALELESAAPADMSQTGAEKSGELTFSMTGTPLGVYETRQKIGTITLTVVNNVT